MSDPTNDTNDTNTATTPAKPAKSKRSTKPATKTPALDDAPSTGVEKVLVFSQRRGIYKCAHLERLPDDRDGTERYTRHAVNLLPGLNSIDGGTFEVLEKTNRRFMSRFDSGEFERIGAFARIKPTRAIAMISTSASLETLLELLEGETRKDVVEALEDEIEELRRRDDAKSDDARDRRRARRGSRARQTRV